MFPYPFDWILTPCGHFDILSHPSQNRRRIPTPQETKPVDQGISGMRTGLGLTDEQEANIHPIIEQQVRKGTSLSRNIRAKVGRASILWEMIWRITTKNQLQYILSNEQMINYGYLQQEEDQRIAGTAVEGIKKRSARKSQEARAAGRGGFRELLAKRR